MIELLRKYPLAIIISLLLHGGLVAALVFQLQKDPDPIGLEESDDAPIQGVIVSEEDIQAEVQRLQDLEEQRARQALEEQQALADTVAALESAQQAAEQRLQEAEQLTQQQLAESEQEKSRIEALQQQAAELEQQRAEQREKSEAEAEQLRALREQEADLTEQQVLAREDTLERLRQERLREEDRISACLLYTSPSPRDS